MRAGSGPHGNVEPVSLSDLCSQRRRTEGIAAVSDNPQSAHEQSPTVTISDPTSPLPRDQRAPLPDRVNLVVIFGGQSGEHEVSRVTAAHVMRAADPSRYAITAIGIGKDGRWIDSTAEAIARISAPVEPGGKPLALDVAGRSFAGLDVQILPPPNAEATDAPTVVMPLLHGPNGEDGTVQGFLELSGMPYIGSGVAGSAVAMDKIIAKELCEANNIPQARWTWLHERDVTPERLDAIVEDLGLPIFVKPANLGSSVGISKAQDRAGLATAVAEALRHDETVVFEEAINGREIEIAVLGNEDPKVSVPGEVVPGADFYDYADKYETGAAKLLIPAELPDDARAELDELAVRCFRVLRCCDLARVDFFYEADGRGWLLNEINTMPGFTPISMYPQLWQASGLSYPDLIDELVHLALDRHAHRGSRRR